MKFLSLKTALLLSACGVVAVAASFSPAQAFSDAEKEEMGQIIREYILENPSIIFEAVEKQRQQESAKAEERTKDFLKNNREALAGKDLPSFGAADADVTVIEFMDYNCGYCKRALPDISKLVGDDKSLRFVFHELPVLGPASRTASLWALAAHKQGKYFEFHSELMKHNGAKTEEELQKLGEKLGLDAAKLKKDAGSQEIQAALDKSKAIADSLGLQGTPAFIVGDQVFRGYIGYDGLLQAIKSERNDG